MRGPEVRSSTPQRLKGRLHGNGYEAECVVSRDLRYEGVAPGPRTISKSTPELPDGVYTLNISGQDSQVRCKQGVWSFVTK
jgi:hypothetical protein